MDWERKPGEPMLWYSRFELYRLLGPERSLLGAYKKWRSEKARKSSRKATGVPEPWRRNAEVWHWRARAEAWDIDVLRQQAEQEEQERIEARKRRIKMARNLQQTSAALIGHGVNADELEEMQPAEARKLLSTAGRLLVDGMNQERVELGMPTVRTDITTKGEKVQVVTGVPVTDADLEAWDEGIRQVLLAQARAITAKEMLDEPDEEIAEAEVEAGNG